MQRPVPCTHQVPHARPAGVVEEGGPVDGSALMAAVSRPPPVPHRRLHVVTLHPPLGLLLFHKCHLRERGALVKTGTRHGTGQLTGWGDTRVASGKYSVTPHLTGEGDTRVASGERNTRRRAILLDTDSRVLLLLNKI